MDKRGETWREYPLDENRTNKEFRLFFSNLGRVKSVSYLCPEGRIIKGSLREGYPIISAKVMLERPKRIQNKIDEFNLKINLLQQELKELKNIQDLPEEVVESRMLILNDRRDEIVQKRSEYTKKTEKKRTSNVHILVHRAIAELFLRKGEADEVVIHKDFVKTNNELANLAWMSKEEAFNRYKEAPYFKKKTYITDRKNAPRKTPKHQKLTESDVLYIKERLSKGKTLKELAKKFGVSDMQIHRIKTGENWSHVKTVAELNNLNNRNKKWQAT